jgi:hypothetical protein
LPYEERLEIHIMYIFFFGEHFFEVKKKTARCQWLMPVILATQEAEIRRITV